LQGRAGNVGVVVALLRPAVVTRGRLLLQQELLLVLIVLLLLLLQEIALLLLVALMIELVHFLQSLHLLLLLQLLLLLCVRGSVAQSVAAAAMAVSGLARRFIYTSGSVHIATATAISISISICSAMHGGQRRIGSGRHLATRQRQRRARTQRPPQTRKHAAQQINEDD
jgi:hypothetical protein